MPLIEYPNELSKSFWDKKKGAVPPAGPLENQLKLLEKKHDAVDWNAFEPGWEKNAKTRAALDEVHSGLERIYRSKVFPLKLEANSAADAAQKLIKDKASAKPTLDAARSVADAVKTYGKAIDDGIAKLEQAHEKASATLKASEADAGDDDDNAAASVLLQPKRLLSQLQMCKRMPERRVHFAFLSDGKTEPLFTLSPKTSGKQLMSKVSAESGIKTGGFGLAWIDDKTLYLQMEKAFSGIVKKMRAPLKTIGFKVSKIVLASEDGKVLEQDEEADEAADAAATAAESTATAAAPAGDQTATPPPAPDDTQLRFTTLLKQLSPAVAAAVAAGGPGAADLKARAGEAAGYGRDKQWAEGLAVLQALQGLLGTAGTATAAAAPARAPSVAPGVAFTQTRLIWDQTRKKVQAELRKLEASILDTCKDESDFTEIATGTKNLYEVLNYLDERLIDKLDEALNAADPQVRRALHDEAREIVEEYVDFVDSEELMQDIDDNGFTSVAIKSTLTTSLTAMGQRLRA